MDVVGQKQEQQHSGLVFLTYVLACLLTAWSRVPLEKLTECMKTLRLNPVSGFRFGPETARIRSKNGTGENCNLLGYYKASSGNSLQTFRDNPSVLSLRVKNLLGFLTLKMGRV